MAKGAKCELFRREMEFLGFLVSGKGVRPVEAKVEAITRLQAPETVSHVRSFLGMTNFFHHHIPSYSEIAAPLTDLLKGVVPGRRRLLWSVGCQASFERLKEALVSAPVLRHFDPNLRTAVHHQCRWKSECRWGGAVAVGGGGGHTSPSVFLVSEVTGCTVPI